MMLVMAIYGDILFDKVAGDDDVDDDDDGRHWQRYIQLMEWVLILRLVCNLKINGSHKPFSLKAILLPSMVRVLCNE